jgi:hypothetical protein
MGDPNLATIIFQIAPNGCFQSASGNTSNILADATDFAPLCSVSTNNAEGLEGIPEQSQSITPDQANRCINLTRKACGG